MYRTKLKIHHIILFLSSLTLSACVTGPTLYTSAQNTPISNPENRVLFAKILKCGYPSSNSEIPLKYGFKLEYENGIESSYEDEINRNSRDCNENEKQDIIPYSNLIQKGDAFSIILNTVWIPEVKEGVLDRFVRFISPGDGGRDIAVVLDINADDGESEPLVVAYQRGVQGDHALNFKNIVVYNTSKWDGIHQPYFHLRVIDVTSERNKNTQEMLDAAAASVNSLAGIVPSSYFPHMAQGIKTAKYILGGSENRILLDYKIQFFNLSVEETQPIDPDTTFGPIDNNTRSVNRILDRFSQGNWLALGRPSETTPEFWENNFYFNRESRTIRVEDASESFEIPYVSMIVVKKDYGVNKNIVKSFNEFSKLILNGETASNSQKLSSLADEIEGFVNEKHKARLNKNLILSKLDNLEFTGDNEDNLLRDSKSIVNTFIAGIDDVDLSSAIESRFSYIFKESIFGFIKGDNDSETTVNNERLVEATKALYNERNSFKNFIARIIQITSSDESSLSDKVDTAENLVNLWESSNEYERKILESAYYSRFNVRIWNHIDRKLRNANRQKILDMFKTEQLTKSLDLIGSIE